MAYQDLREFLKPDLELPIGGKLYRIPSPNAAEGLRLRLLFVKPEEVLGDAEEVEEVAKLLGAHWEPNLVELPVYDPVTGHPLLMEDGDPVTRTADRGRYVGGVWQEMADDGVSWPELDRAGRTALLHYAVDPTVAAINWAGLEGDAGNSPPPEPTTVPGARSSSPKKRAAAKKSTSRSRERTGRKTPAAGNGSPRSD